MLVFNYFSLIETAIGKWSYHIISVFVQSHVHLLGENTASVRSEGGKRSFLVRNLGSAYLRRGPCNIFNVREPNKL